MVEAVYDMSERDRKNGITISGQPFDERYFNYYLNTASHNLRINVLDPNVYNSRNPNDENAVIYQIDKNKSPLFNCSDAKTAVLFICHIVSDESIFRYNLLKTACDKLGYDVFWAIDKDSRLASAPSNISFYKFSCRRYAAEMPFAVYQVKQSQYLNSAAAATMLFWKDCSGKYDRFWVVEYDVCLAGKWSDFFKKYSDENIDFAVNRFIVPSPDINKWYHY